MSLTDQTNERIPLSQHEPFYDGAVWGPYLEVDVDQDSSFEPPHWVHIAIVDADHDSDRVKLTYEEAGLLHDRLSLILGRGAQ